MAVFNVIITRTYYQLNTTRPDRVRESAAGSEIPLTRQEWYRLFAAAGHTVP